jgi:hypothetical protein
LDSCPALWDRDYFLKSDNSIFSAEHLCNANGGAVLNIAQSRQENIAQNFVPLSEKVAPCMENTLHALASLSEQIKSIYRLSVKKI